MTGDHDDLRRAFQAFAAAQRPLGREGCPSAAAMAASFEAGAPRRRKRRIVDHLSKCAACREEFGLYFDLQAFHAGLPDRAAGDAKTAASNVPSRPARWSASPLWNHAFLAVGFALVVTVFLLLFRSADFDRTRRTGTADVKLVYPRSAHDGAAELVFRWRGFPSADRYVLELFDGDLLPVWSSPPTGDTQLRLPPDLASRLVTGARFYWTVTAYSGPDKIGESGMRRFVVLRE